MKYFIDTEFREDFTKPWLGKPKHFIELISIGIVAEDGREYYAISNEFDIDACWNKYDLKPAQGDAKNHHILVREYWLRGNVLKQIHGELAGREGNLIHEKKDWFTLSAFKALIKKYGKPNNQIAKEIIDFFNPECMKRLQAGTWPEMSEVKLHNPNKEGLAQPEIYGYFSDYDWVLFCSLFGRMIDLPKGFPMYCRDLKQVLDETEQQFREKDIMVGNDGKLFRFGKERMILDSIKSHPSYPKQANAHNALDDARWNKKLYDFIQAI